MKAITIWQPWATAIALGLKRYETRQWSTSYRGPILIHAGARWTFQERQFQWGSVHWLRADRSIAESVALAFEQNPPLGAVVAVGDLVECVRTEAAITSPMERYFGDFSPGRFAWQIENVIKLSPIAVAGSQGLWTPSSEVQDLVGEMLRFRAIGAIS